MQVYDVNDASTWKGAFKAFQNLLLVCDQGGTGYHTLAKACGNTLVQIKKFHGVVLAGAPRADHMRGTNYQANTDIVVGLMTLKQESKTHVHLADVVAYPGRHGYGAVLISYAISKAIELGGTKLTLHAADDELVPYYERYDFVVESGHDMTFDLTSVD